MSLGTIFNKFYMSYMERVNLAESSFSEALYVFGNKIE